MSANVPFTAARPADRKVHIMNGVDYNVTASVQALPITADVAVTVPGKFATISAGSFTLGAGTTAATPVFVIKSDTGTADGGYAMSNAAVEGYNTTNNVKMALFDTAIRMKLMIPALSYVAGTYAEGTELTVVTGAGDANRGKLTAAVAGKVVVARVSTYNGFSKGAPVSGGTTQPYLDLLATSAHLCVDTCAPYIKA